MQYLIFLLIFSGGIGPELKIYATFTGELLTSEYLFDGCKINGIRIGKNRVILSACC